MYLHLREVYNRKKCAKLTYKTKVYRFIEKVELLKTLKKGAIIISNSKHATV